MKTAVSVMEETKSAGNRWSEFKTLIRKEAGRWGRIMEVQDNDPPSEKELDVRPLKARVWVQCATCEQVLEIWYEADPPTGGWGDILPVEAVEYARTAYCSCT